MRYYILESGSKGNSTLIFSKGKYLLIDNGLSERKFRSYLNEINVQIEKCNDLSQRVLMYRLYTEYLKNLNKDTTEQTDKKLFIKLLFHYNDQFHAG